MAQKLDKILVLDFGSQYTKLIARRIRECSVYCEIQRFDYPVHKINEFSPKGIVLSGGPASVLDEQSPKIDPEILKMDIPILGICYGMQLICLMDGGRVKAADKREYGQALVDVAPEKTLFEEIPNKTIKVWMSHGDKVVAVPPGFASIAKSPNCEYAAIADEERNIYCLQFHPEVTHTPEGMQIIRNFLFKICHCKPNWNMGSFAEQAIVKIKEQVGEGRVICGLSGGVDSAVTSVLIHKAIKDQLTCIFVDNGLLRKHEAQKVIRIFRENFKINLVVVDAEKRFLRKLRDAEEPEMKRKIIGNEFINVFDEEARKIKDVKFLAQGTLYPDVIESTSFKGPSSVIKSHHNVGGLPEKMGLKLIEPLRELFKDEVRQVGRELGIPEEVVGRQPFPGPGLAIRIVGEVTKERLDMLREADDAMMDEIKKAGWYGRVWQTFCVLLPVKTVGVMGDERTYENVIAFRAVDSQDGMTADWVNLPYELLGRISNRIINEVAGVNRVVYDISSKPPATIEWE